MKVSQLIEACREEWQGYIEHSFVHQLADGSLKHEAFLHYLKQDFLFLKHYTERMHWLSIKRRA